MQQHITGTLLRSPENPIRLLHRSNSRFFIMGTTGNVYTVTISATPICTCPDPTVPCKHILFLYIHILSLSGNDPCLRRRILRPCELARLLSGKVSGEAVASVSIRRRFHELYRRGNGGTCPVCLEELGRGVGGGRVVACATCKNPIHVVCLMAWKNKRSRTCVICRSRWREMRQEDKYINLLGHVCEDDNVAKNIIVGINVN